MGLRTKKKIISNVTLEAAQEASSTFTAFHTKLAKVEAEMNGKINRIKDSFSDEITLLKDGLEEPTEVLKVYATEQQKNWGKKKSVGLLHTNIGFRTGNPTVAKSKKYTWEGVADLVKAHVPSFLRTKEEVNKEAILALDKDDKLLVELKSKCSITIEQTETFFVEVKKEDIAA